MLRNRIALITGASRGIGQAVAVRFAKEGAHVILVARNSKGLEETDDLIRAHGGSSTLVPLDLTEFSKIDDLARQVNARFGKLDILVGNAAILGELTPLPHMAASDWDKVMALNVTANFHLIRCFDALLKLSDQPRALFVTSGVTLRATAFWSAYTTSKAALEAMVKTYASENVKTPLRVNVIDPGRTRTRMRASAFPGEDPMALPAPEYIADLFVKLAGADVTDTGGVFGR